MNRNTLLIIATALVLLGSRAAAAEPAFEPRDCVIGPHTVLDVSSAVPGLLEVVMAERTDTVHAGQVLARLESGTERASLELARAWSSIDSEVQIEQTVGVLEKRREERISRLFASQAVALDDKEQAETEADLARLRLRQAKEKRWIRELDARKAQAALERRTVRSPIDGVVVERYRGAGEYVENQPILRIARLDPLEVETILPMSAFGQVEPGMVAEVRTENEPDSPHRAVVSLVDRMGDVASGTFGVRLTLPNPGNRIPAGLKCTLSFVYGETAPVPPREVPDLARAAESAAPAGTGETPGRTTGASPADEAADVPADAASDLPSIAPQPRDEMTRVATRTPSSAGACLRVGPMMSADAALLLSARASHRGHITHTRKAAFEPAAGFIVLTPRQADQEAAAALAGDLLEAGMGEAEVLHRGAFARRVSLGVYDGRTMAELRRDAVRARGFEVDVVERTRDGWWVSVSGQVDTSDTGWLESAAPGVDVESVPCSGTETHRAEASLSQGDAS